MLTLGGPQPINAHIPETPMCAARFSSACATTCFEDFGRLALCCSQDGNISHVFFLHKQLNYSTIEMCRPTKTKGGQIVHWRFRLGFFDSHIGATYTFDPTPRSSTLEGSVGPWSGNVEISH